MIRRKKKLCAGKGEYEGKGCGKLTYLYSHGLCGYCYNRLKPKVELKKSYIKKFKPTYQNDIRMSEKEAFLRAWELCRGKCFIGDKIIPLEELKSWNCMHVLDKKNFPYYKYYHQNIIIGLKAQHDLIDQGTLRGIIKRIYNTNETKNDWRKFFELKKYLKRDYEQWVEKNPKKYRI